MNYLRHKTKKDVILSEVARERSEHSDEVEESHAFPSVRFFDFDPRFARIFAQDDNINVSSVRKTLPRGMIARAAVLLTFVTAIASAQPAATQPVTQPTGLNSIVSAVNSTLQKDANPPAQASSWVKWVVLATVLSLAPALAVMVTSFTRIVVVLGLLRQALATPNLPPNQVLFALALLMTVVVMTPVIQDVYTHAYEPWSAGTLSNSDALAAGEKSVRGFMIRQLEAGDNTSMVYTFLPKDQTSKQGLSWRDVPTWSLIPAFVLGELKIAFLMGLRIFLPFVMIDMLVGSVLVSMGILMLPPVLIALPFKLLMFVLADGWALVAGTLMNSFG